MPIAALDQTFVLKTRAEQQPVPNAPSPQADPLQSLIGSCQGNSFTGFWVPRSRAAGSDRSLTLNLTNETLSFSRIAPAIRVAKRSARQSANLARRSPQGLDKSDRWEQSRGLSLTRSRRERRSCRAMEVCQAFVRLLFALARDRCQCQTGRTDFRRRIWLTSTISRRRGRTTKASCDSTPNRGWTARFTALITCLNQGGDRGA